MWWVIKNQNLRVFVEAERDFYMWLLQYRL